MISIICDDDRRPAETYADSHVDIIIKDTRVTLMATMLRSNVAAYAEGFEEMDCIEKATAYGLQ